MARRGRISSPNDLLTLLGREPETLRNEVARIVAVRTALRVLPLVADASMHASDSTPDAIKVSILVACRAVLVAKRSVAAEDIANAAAEAAAHVDKVGLGAVNANARSAVVSAARVLFGGPDYTDASRATARAASNTVQHAVAASNWFSSPRSILEAVERDYDDLLMDDRLWSALPQWALDAVRRFRTVLERFGGAWPLWSRWYDAVIEGGGSADSFEKSLDPFLTRGDEFWDRDPDEVMAEIGQAVGWPQPFEDKEPAPEASIQQLAELASPQTVLIETGRRLDAVPNAIYDALKADRAYFIVAEAQAVLSRNIHDAAPENAGRSLRVFLTSYSVELIERPSAPNALKLQQAGQIIDRDFDSEETAYWSKGLEQAIASWRDNHIAIMAYLSENARREADFARIPVDQSPKALAQLRRELSRFGEAARALSEAGHTTERFDGAVEELQEQGKLIEALPELLLDQPLSQAVSVRKRFILSAIGFVAKTARVVGLAGTAYLISNPGQALATFASIVDSILGILKTLLAP